MSGVSKTLNFLSGQPLFDIQLPAAMDHCKPYIEAAFPEITDIDPDTLAPLLEGQDSNEKRQAICAEWVAQQTEKVGKTYITLMPLTEGEKVGFYDKADMGKILSEVGFGSCDNE